MTIRISRNAAGNCITFSGATQPAYWNACLSAQVNQTDNTRVDVINDIRSAAQGDIFYEFYAVDFAGFSNADGETFTSAQEMADYINLVGNVTGTGAEGIDLNAETSVNFRLDQTQTSIFMSTGHQFGVNTIKALANTDGTIHILAIGEGAPSDDGSTVIEKEHFQKIIHTAVQINGAAVSGGLNDVVNALNELFTVGAFQSVVIADPYSTMVADVTGTTTTGTIVGTYGVDPVGDDIFAASSTGSLNGWKSTDTINQAGEYFTFQIRNRGQIGFGLIASDATYTNALYAKGSNTTYINPAQFGVGNSAHSGFQFSHWFHPTPNGSWTNYGANTGYVMGPAWSGATTHFEARDEWVAGTPITIRVGINENGFIHIDSLADDGVTWKQHARTSYSVREGSAYHLGIKMGDTTVRLYSTPKVHLLEPAAPTMYFRYIESPDGVYQYPLFATEAEANYYDQNHDGVTGSGSSHTHIYPDDPTNTTWYMADTGSTMTGAIAPLADTFLGNQVFFTEITSLTNADLVPPVFTAATLTVDEGSTLNYQTQPMDTAYTTTFSGLEGTIDSIIDIGAGMLTGTAPEVSGDNVANPSDTYLIGVHRTNSYGTSTGTLTLVVNNLTAPTVNAITGFTHEAASTALVDSDTLDDGSVVRITEVVGDGERLVIDKEWFDRNVFPAIRPGTGTKLMKIGFGNDDGNPSEDWSQVQTSNYWIHYEYLVDDDARTNNAWRLRPYVQNTLMANVGVGGLNYNSPALYDIVFENDNGDVKMGALVASQNHDASTKVYDTNDSAWNWEYSQSTGTVGDKSIYIQIDNAQMDIDTTNIAEYAMPTAPTSLTSWTKALDFSGAAERAQMVDSSYNRVAQKMSGINNNVAAPTVAGNTSSDSNSRPWANAIVFKADTYNDNQHIWNVGEGTGDTDDNIYLRRDANRDIWFGWGRPGELNECYVGSIASNIGGWWAVYVASTGERVGGGHTADEIADCFDIRFTGGSSNWAVGTNKSTSANWTSGSFGGRMNREFTGDMTIGGRGANRSFRGKVASYVSTTLRQGVAMPTDAEIAEMITDPMQWLQDYKVGNGFRLPWQGNDAGFNFSMNDGSSGYSTQVYLMGDGTNDSYANMIRNQVHPSDQNYTKLNMISMVSSDIETVTIPGLT